MIAAYVDIPVTGDPLAGLPGLPQHSDPDHEGPDQGFMSLLLAMQQQGMPMPPQPSLPPSLPTANDPQVVTIAGVQAAAAPLQRAFLPQSAPVTDTEAAPPPPAVSVRSLMTHADLMSGADFGPTQLRPNPLPGKMQSAIPEQPVLPMPRTSATSRQPDPMSPAPVATLPMLPAFSRIARPTAMNVTVLPPVAADAPQASAPLTPQPPGDAPRAAGLAQPTAAPAVSIGAFPVVAQQTLPDMQHLLRMVQPNATTIVGTTPAPAAVLAGQTAPQPMPTAQAAVLVADESSALPLPHHRVVVATVADIPRANDLWFVVPSTKRTEAEPLTVPTASHSVAGAGDRPSAAASALLSEPGTTPVPEVAAPDAPAALEPVRATIAAADHPIRELRLELTPAHLGTVTLELHHVGRQVEAFMIVDHEPARQVLQAAEQQVRELLGQQGLQVGAFEVSCRGGDQQPRQPLPQATPAAAAEEPSPPPAHRPALSRRSTSTSSDIDIYA